MAGTLDTVDLETVASVNTAASLHQQQQVLNYVHGSLGIPQLQRPQAANPSLPSDITSLDDNQLGYQLSLCAQWVGYIDYQLAHANGERQQAEAYLNYVQARIRLAIKARGGEKKLTTKDKDDIMETNEEVIRAREKYMFWESTYQLTKSIRDNTQLAWETISRRITQRGQEVDRMRRENNVANVPVPGRTFMRPG